MKITPQVKNFTYTLPTISKIGFEEAKKIAAALTLSEGEPHFIVKDGGSFVAVNQAEYEEDFNGAEIYA